MARSYNMSSEPANTQPAETAGESSGVAGFFQAHWKAIPILLISGAVVAAAAFGVVKLKEHNEDVTITRTWEEIKAVANDDDTDTTEASTSEDTMAAQDPAIERGHMYPSDPMQRVINWEGILAINPNIECWIYIPETNIDYPIMRPAKWSDNNYYLTHDVYGNQSSAGSIYMPAKIEGYEDKDMHRIVIGHNMRNGSMFSSLVNYKDKSYWEAAPYIYLYYPDRTEKWQIYSPYHTTQADTIYNLPFEAGTVLYQQLLQDVESKKAYDTAANGPSVNEPLLTLTTCDRTSTEGKDGRFVVNAKLVKTSTAVVSVTNETPEDGTAEAATVTME